MSNVLADSPEQEDSSRSDSSPIPAAETGEVQEEPYTVHISHSDETRTLEITELSARTLLSILDNVTAKGSAAKFQLAIAQQELEKGLASLDQSPPAKPNRAARRAAAKTY